MRDALRTLGVDIVEDHGQWQVTPPKAFVGGGTIDCGLAGTVMRFVPPIAALAEGTVRFDGDQQAYTRPMAPLLGALKRLGARVDGRRLLASFQSHRQPEAARRRRHCRRGRVQPVPQRPAARWRPICRRHRHPARWAVRSPRARTSR